MRFLEKVLFYLFVFCLPAQVRYIVWPLGEAFGEWSSAFFYLTDAFLVALLLLWAFRRIKEKNLKFEFSVLSLFLVVAAISLIQLPNLKISIYHWLKLVEFAFLFIYVKENIGRLLSPRIIAWLLVLSGLFQSVVAVGQFMKQQSLGLKFLGESTIGLFVAGSAKFVVGDDLVQRAYGTLPHANILAAFLVLAIFSLYYLYLSRQSYSIYINLAYGVLLMVLWTGLWVTFSRTIIISLLVFSLIYFIFVFKKYRPQIKFLILIFVLMMVVFTWTFWPLVVARMTIGAGEQAVTLRVEYNQVAYSFITQAPLFGVGLGNFVESYKLLQPDLPVWQYQPAHNIYLMVASEMGLLGLVIFLYFLYSILRKKQQDLFGLTIYFVFLAFLVMGLFDHYLWDLQQGSLIFWLVLGILACHQFENEKPQL